MFYNNAFTIYVNNATITVLAEMGQLANHDGRAKKSGQAHD
jgi:hypothetical protein